MKYCKKCGAELAEGVSFCEKCGNPVGEVPKQGSGKKKWVFAISSGVILLAVGIVGGLFAMGIIGGKDNVVQTSTDTADIQETPGVTGEAVETTEELEGDKQKDALKNSNTEEMAWEAFQVYKSCIEEDRERFNEDYEEEYGDDEDYEYDYDYYNGAHKFLLAYVDDDDYPELFIREYFNSVSIYTYKDGVAVKDDFYTDAASEISLDYWKKSGYIYSVTGRKDWAIEIMFQLDGTEVKNIDENTDGDVLGKNKILQQKGITGGKWTQTTLYKDNSVNGYELFSETVDEAYTQFLTRENK